MASAATKDDLEMGSVSGGSSGGSSGGGTGVPPGGGDRKKKLIYFSDGSTMEQEEEEVEEDSVEDKVCQKDGGTLQSAPGVAAVDPSQMTWPEWMKHYSSKGGSNVLGGLENAGEKLAYFFGITTPKYQTEIDEYNRMVAKREAEAAEAKAWSGTNPSFVPIVEDPSKQT